MRRLVSGLAAIVAVLATSMVWAQPAQAAPLCSVEEWQIPANFADCAGRFGREINETLGCAAAPTPGSPTSGMPGLFSTRPESSLRSGVTGQYSTYGVGGYTIETYDLGCLADLRHPGISTWNTIAAGEFWLAGLIIAVANGLRDWAYDPVMMWGWADAIVEKTSTSLFKFVFLTVGAIAVVAVGLLLITRARDGRLADALKTAGWMVLVAVVVTGVARWPLAAAHAADSAASAGLAGLHHAVGQGPQHIPADQCVLGPEACVDHRSVAVRSSDTVTEAILYRAWLRAVLGTDEGPTAEKYGPALFDATTLSWEEDARAKQSPALRQQLIDQKAATFNAIAAQLKSEDPQAYEHLQGIHGWDRASSGLFALAGAIAFAFFDIVASLVIMFGFLAFRITVVLAPLVGSVGVYRPAGGGVRRLANTAAGAGINIVVFGGVGGLYLTLVQGIFASPLNPALQITIIGLLSGALMFLLRPLRHVVATVKGRADDKGGAGTWLFNKGREMYAGSRQVEEAPTPPVQQVPEQQQPVARPRPEAEQGPTQPTSVPPPAGTPAPPAPTQRPEGAIPVTNPPSAVSVLVGATRTEAKG